MIDQEKKKKDFQILIRKNYALKKWSRVWLHHTDFFFFDIDHSKGCKRYFFIFMILVTSVCLI